MNDWFKILEANRAGKFNYDFGPTPRFIIGGCQIPIGSKFASEAIAKEAMAEIFEEMRTFNRDGLIVMSNECDCVKGPVLALNTMRWSENSIGTSFEKIWERYGQEIIDGNYHIDKNERIILEKIFEI